MSNELIPAARSMRGLLLAILLCSTCLLTSCPQSNQQAAKANPAVDTLQRGKASNKVEDAQQEHVESQQKIEELKAEKAAIAKDIEKMAAAWESESWKRDGHELQTLPDSPAASVYKDVQATADKLHVWLKIREIERESNRIRAELEARQNGS